MSGGESARRGRVLDERRKVVYAAVVHSLGDIPSFEEFTGPPSKTPSGRLVVASLNPLAIATNHIRFERKDAVRENNHQTTHTLEPFDRRRVLEEAKARLSALADSLSDFNIDAAGLHKNAEELSAVIHRIEWLTDVSAVPPDQRN
jgi:hypothetical protein